MQEAKPRLEQALKKDPKKSGLLATFKAVAWSFFGVRRGSDHDDDMANLNPIHVVFAGIVAGALFVLTLIAVVKYVV